MSCDIQRAFQRNCIAGINDRISGNIAVVKGNDNTHTIIKQRIFSDLPTTVVQKFQFINIFNGSGKEFVVHSKSCRANEIAAFDVIDRTVADIEIGISGVDSVFTAENNGIDGNTGGGININIARCISGFSSAGNIKNAVGDIEINILFNSSISCTVNRCNRTAIDICTHTVSDFKVNFFVTQNSTVVKFLQFRWCILPDIRKIHFYGKIINIQGCFAACFVGIKTVVERIAAVVDHSFFAVGKSSVRNMINNKFSCGDPAVRKRVYPDFSSCLPVKKHGNSISSFRLFPAGK